MIKKNNNERKNMIAERVIPKIKELENLQQHTESIQDLFLVQSTDGLFLDCDLPSSLDDRFRAEWTDNKARATIYRTFGSAHSAAYYSRGQAIRLLDLIAN